LITTRSDNHNHLVFLGLAPFLRKNIAGHDLVPLGQEMLAELENAATNPNLWMNLATVMLCLGQRELGLSMQAQALAIQRIYHLRPEQAVQLRVLLVMTAGDLAANTPLDCLLENSDIELIYFYVSAPVSLDLDVPDHDVLMVAISEADENSEVLASLQLALSNWPKPVLNAPHKITRVERQRAAQLLQQAPGLFVPEVIRISRGKLQNIAQAKTSLSQIGSDWKFPLIVRPVGSHAGRDLEKLENAKNLRAYLVKVANNEFFLSPFIDYSCSDGLFRKYRVALIAGVPFACHMAVSEHWMIHYINAGMYNDALKRQEEEAFMLNFPDFAQRHQAALTVIYERTQLDYLCIDCAETQDGQLFVFEIDHAMVVHAMDPEEHFPYKQVYMHKLKQAFRAMLFGLTGKSTLQV
jgi:glutathione synthase/RimK-type ligase-like ATP-grasp enzyme